MGFCHLFIYLCLYFFFSFREKCSLICFFLCVFLMYTGRKRRFGRTFTLFTLEWEKLSFMVTQSHRVSMSSTWNVMETVNQIKAQCSLPDIMLVLLLPWGNSWVSLSLTPGVTLGIPAPCLRKSLQSLWSSAPAPERPKQSWAPVPYSPARPSHQPCWSGPISQTSFHYMRIDFSSEEAELVITIKKFAQALDPISDPYSLCKFNVLKRNIIILLLFTLYLLSQLYLSSNWFLYYILNGWKLT